MGSGCQVPGCGVESEGAGGYAKHRVCPWHAKAEAVAGFRAWHAAAGGGGGEVRWCQRCKIFEVLGRFQGRKRSCEASLQVHNRGRRSKREVDGAAEPRAQRRKPKVQKKQNLPRKGQLKGQPRRHPVRPVPVDSSHAGVGPWPWAWPGADDKCEAKGAAQGAAETAETADDIELAAILTRNLGGAADLGGPRFADASPRISLVASFRVCSPHRPTVCVKHPDGSLTPTAGGVPDRYQEWLKAIVRPLSRTPCAVLA